MILEHVSYVRLFRNGKASNTLNSAFQNRTSRRCICNVASVSSTHFYVKNAICPFWRACVWLRMPACSFGSGAVSDVICSLSIPLTTQGCAVFSDDSTCFSWACPAQQSLLVPVVPHQAGPPLVVRASIGSCHLKVSSNVDFTTSVGGL